MWLITDWWSFLGGNNKCLTNLLSEFEILALIPWVECVLDVSVDLRVVPEEVVWDSLEEDGRVKEDLSPVSELVEVVADHVALSQVLGQLVDDLSHDFNAAGVARDAACLEVSDHLGELVGEGVSALHAGEQVVQVVLVDDTVDDTGGDFDDVGAGEGVGGLHGEGGNEQES